MQPGSEDSGYLGLMVLTCSARTGVQMKPPATACPRQLATDHSGLPVSSLKESSSDFFGFVAAWAKKVSLANMP